MCNSATEPARLLQIFWLRPQWVTFARTPLARWLGHFVQALYSPAGLYR